METLKLRAKSEEVQFDLGCKRYFHSYPAKKIPPSNSEILSFLNISILTPISQAQSDPPMAPTVLFQFKSRISSQPASSSKSYLTDRFSQYRWKFLTPPPSFSETSVTTVSSLMKRLEWTYCLPPMVSCLLMLDRCMEQIPTPSDESFSIPVKTQSTISNIYEAVTHFADLSVEKTVPMPWIFNLHFNDADNDSLIQHDIVYLEHT